MNKGDVNEWLKQCPESKREEIMRLADSVSHDCYSCWWFQQNDNNTRGCKYDQLTGEKLPFRKETDICSWTCLGWRVDPEARRRERGIYGFIR